MVTDLTRFTVLSFLVTNLLSQSCKDLNLNLKKEQTKVVVQRCLAECMGLTMNDLVKKPKSPCKFDSLTGHALGDPCTEDFKPASRDKTLGCLYNTQVFATSAHVLNKVCDFIVFSHLLEWKRDTKKLIEYTPMINEVKPFIAKARENNAKIWMRLGSTNSATDLEPVHWSEIANDASLRKSVIKYLSEFMKTYDLEGVYIYWFYPGCPGGQCKPEYSKDRVGGISLFKELSAVLHPEGRLIIFPLPLIDYGDKRLALGPDFYTIINRYTNFTIIEAHGQMSTGDEYTSYSRNVPKMINSMKTIMNLVGPGLKKKTILSRDFTFFSIVLLAPNKSPMQIKYNKTASRGSLYLTEVCEMFRKTNYTIQKNVNNQHYAYANMSLVFYEDIDSIKSEVNEVVKFFDMPGMFVEHLYFDDVEGACGAGRMPFTRMYAEALKGGACTFKPIY